MLPDEILLSLYDQYPCRNTQIQALASLLDTSTACPSSLVVHGLEATGKSLILREVLVSLKTPHAIIDSRQCITGRHLLEQTVAATADAVEVYHGIYHPDTGRCENLTALQVQLSNLLEAGKEMVLVFDSIDRQREAPPTLVPALARIAETIPSLTVVFVLAVPSPRLFHTAGIPYLHFPPYTRADSLEILALTPMKIFKDGLDPNVDYTEADAAEDDAYVWSRFCGVVWDTLAKGAARDIVSFRRLCEKLWPSFTAPIVAGTFGTRDFARLMVSRRSIFQDESVLLHNLVRKTAPADQSAKASPMLKHELPYYAKYLLCAAYLASFNPPKQDSIFFMKSHEKKRRKKNSGPKLQHKSRRIPRALLAPSPFPLDRLLAILHAVLPHKAPQTADVLAQVATLASLRLIARAGAASADAMDASSRWRVNVGWEFVVSCAGSVGFEIREYLASSVD